MGSKSSKIRCYNYNELYETYYAYRKTKTYPVFKYKDEKSKTKLKFVFMNELVKINGKIRDMKFRSLSNIDTKELFDRNGGFVSDGECTYNNVNDNIMIFITPLEINFITYKKEKWTNKINKYTLFSVNMINRNYD